MTRCDGFGILVLLNQNQMKHLMTLMALVVAVTAGAQGTTIHEYPWNPDSNNDNLIGVDDLLDFLPVFGDEFGLPPEPCTYDGSDFEDLMFRIYNQLFLTQYSLNMNSKMYSNTIL